MIAPVQLGCLSITLEPEHFWARRPTAPVIQGVWRLISTSRYKSSLSLVASRALIIRRSEESRFKKSRLAKRKQIGA